MKARELLQPSLLYFCALSSLFLLCGCSQDCFPNSHRFSVPLNLAPPVPGTVIGPHLALFRCPTATAFLWPVYFCCKILFDVSGFLVLNFCGHCKAFCKSKAEGRLRLSFILIWPIIFHCFGAFFGGRGTLVLYKGTLVQLQSRKYYTLSLLFLGVNSPTPMHQDQPTSVHRPCHPH